MAIKDKEGSILFSLKILFISQKAIGNKNMADLGVVSKASKAKTAENTESLKECRILMSGI